MGSITVAHTDRHLDLQKFLNAVDNVHNGAYHGGDCEEIIYHGHTLTSKIRFMDVLKAIKENAFVASEYPLIITVEQHCDLPQQRFMARAFKEYLGGKFMVVSCGIVL